MQRKKLQTIIVFSKAIDVKSILYTNLITKLQLIGIYWPSYY